MEAIAGLSLAANIAQFVVYGFRGARYLYKAYDQTADLVREQSELSVITESIQTSGDAVRDIPEAAVDAELSKILDQAKLLADELLQHFEKLQRRASQPLAKARIAFHSLRVKSDVERLLKRLTALRDQVTARLIILASQSRSSDRAKLDKLHPMIKSNHQEVSDRLDELYDDLTESWAKMNNLSEGKQLDLLGAIADEVAATAKHCMLRKRVENVLQSLRFANIADRQSTILKAHRETFQWALSATNSDATLPNWLRSENGIYWIEGKAGSGKSTLMKFLQQDDRTTSLLKEWAGGRPLNVIGHYFWAPGTELQRSLIGLFRTLLFQILVKDPELVEKLCPSRSKEDGYDYLRAWTLDELEASFQILSSMESLPTKLCFFIDGLDEFEGSPATLIDIIQSLSNSKSGDVKFCVASRPWLRFQEAFGQSPWKLAVHEYTKGDIQRYALDCLGRNEQYKLFQSRSLDQAESLVRDISDMADGVFLWVYLVVQDLLDGLSNQDDLPTLKKRLEGMPRELDAYFQRMLDSIDEVYRAEAFSIFGMLAYTRLPLSTLLTWGHRRFREQSASVPIDAYEFSCHTMNISSSARQVKWGSRRTVSGYDVYEAESERRRIVARCRDLVHVSEEVTLTQGIEVHSVGFLHRTVAEFIGSAVSGHRNTAHLTQQDTAKTRMAKYNKGALATLGLEDKDVVKFADRDVFMSRNPVLMSIVSLAEAYVELLISSSLISSSPVSLPVETEVLKKKDNYILQNVFYPEFVDWILYLATQAQKHSPSAYLYVTWRLCILFPREESGYESLIQQRLNNIIATAMASNVSVEKDCVCEDIIHPELQSAFWILHCRNCVATYYTKSLLFLCDDLCFRTHQAPTLSEDGTMTLTDSLQVTLSVVETLVRVLRADGSNRFDTAWAQAVRNLHERALTSGERIPQNIYDVCLVFIRNGAPRWIPQTTTDVDSEYDAALDHKAETRDDAISLLQTIPQIQAIDPGGVRMMKEFRNAEKATSLTGKKGSALWSWISGICS